MKYLLLACTCLLASLLNNNVAQASEQKDCTIEFKLNSSVVLQNKNELDICLNQLEQKNIEAVTVIGSATQSGSSKRNKKLAKERALTISRIVKAKFPNAVIKNIDVGANEEIGKKTQIHFVLTDESAIQQTAKLQEQINLLEQNNRALENELEKKEKVAALENSALAAQQEKNKEAEKHSSFFNEDPNFRVAVRGGVDSTRVKERHNYASIGGEFSWLNRDKYLRPEVGVKATSSIADVKINGDTVNQVSNVYGFFGIGATALGLVGGVRLLVGGEWIDIANNIPHEDQVAVGGEARLGYEWKKGVSIFGSYGLTEHLQMIGVDIGVSL